MKSVRRNNRSSSRRSEFRRPNIESYLIVTEGKRTEPNYFKGLKELIPRNADKNNIEIKVISAKCSTVSLIEYTEERINRSPKVYSKVWVVFDRDDFDDFDEAIKLASSAGFNVAWSNVSFEYFLYLHFGYSTAAKTETGWESALTKQYSKHDISGKYDKLDPKVFAKTAGNGRIKNAIKNAEKRMRDFDTNGKASDFDPGTTVHILVRELSEYLI